VSAPDSTPVSTPTTGLRAVLRTRGASVFVLIALLSPLLLVFTSYEAVLWCQRPNIGLQLRVDATLRSADSRWRDVRRGDRVVAINGVEPEDEAALKQMLYDLQPGTLTIDLLRDGEPIQRSAEARPRSSIEKAVIGLRMLLGAALVIIGLLVFALSPGRRVSWLFLLFSFALACFLWLVVAIEHYGAIFLLPVFFFVVAATAIGVHLFSLFPRPLELSWRRGLLLVVYAAGGLQVATHALFELIRASDEMRVAARTASSIYMGLGAGIIVFLIYLQQRQARRAEDYRALVRGRLVLIGALLGLCLPAIWNALRMTMDLGEAEWAVHLNTAPVVLFVAMTAYAMVRHNALAVDRFALAVVGYSATLALLGIGFAALLIGLPLLVGQASALQSPAAVAVMTALAFVGFTPLYRRLKRRVDELFARGETGDRTAAVLRELARVAQRAGRVRSYQAALEALDSLRLERAEIWILDDDGAQFGREAHTRRTGPVDRLPRAGLFGQAIVKGGRGGGLQGLAPVVLEPGAQTELGELGLALAVPLTPFGAVAGFIGLGRKKAGTAFSEEEQTFVEAVAAQLAMVMERASVEGAQLGRYRVERRLGVGGMAEVYLAWQLGPGGFERKVALKRLLPNLAEEPELVAMFLDEARIAAQLSHRHIAQIHEVGKEEGGHFIAMEYVDGPSLRQLIRSAVAQAQPVPVPIAAAIAEATLGALAHAHVAVDAHDKPLGVVHRDVTPSNVQLTREGEVKLLDFGIARAATQLHVTRTGQAKGTLPYMSAEQVLAEPVDQRADLYSLGVVFYELLSGQHAFAEGPTRERPTPLAELRDDVPPALEQVIGRAIAFDARDRFADADAMHMALLEALEPAQPAPQATIALWLAGLVPPQRGKAGPADEKTLTDDPERTKPLGPRQRQAMR